MAILTGFPPSNTIRPKWVKPHFDKDNPTKEQIEALKAWYYGPSPIKVKWKERVPWTCPLTGMVHYLPKKQETE